LNGQNFNYAIKDNPSRWKHIKISENLNKNLILFCQSNSLVGISPVELRDFVPCHLKAQTASGWVRAASPSSGGPSRAERTFLKNNAFNKNLA
jgi:hypothetical protein